MPRTERIEPEPQFEEQSDFNDTMYKALKAAPWWMVSIAAHLLIGIILSLLSSDQPADRSAQMVKASMNAAEPPPEEDVPETPEETEQIQQQEIVAKEPVVTDAELADRNETDNDMPFEEMFGEAGISDAPFSGPANNGLIGIGGSAGGAFKGRGGNKNLRAGGGGKQANDAVEDALRWLAAHQSADGGWEAEGFRKWCDGKIISGEGPDGAGKAQYDVGVTGFALLAFLGAGYTNRSDHAFGKVVANGLKYLRNVQDAEGCFGSRSTSHFVYNHAIAALAMVEAYGMTGSPNFKNPAQKALDFISISRNPYFAWRYGIKPGDNDTSVTGWMMMALKSAKLINEADKAGGRAESLTFDVDAFDGIKSWIDRMTDQDYGRVGYQQRGSGPARTPELVDKFPADKSESMTGVGMLARIFLGEDPKTSDPIKKGAELCAKLPPKWDPNDGSIDMYYWYYATLAMYQVGGKPWDIWEKGLKSATIDTQRKDTDYCMYKGSWDPIDPWGPDGGRVYSTACQALCLQVWYRYPKVFGTAGSK